MFKEFRDFAIKGNVLDLAIGVIIGAGFGKIVTSFTNDLLMPPIGLLLGKVDFSNLYVNLSGHHVESLAEAKKLGIPTLNYGIFLNSVIDFALVAFSVFLLVKIVNRWKLAPALGAGPATTKECPHCTSMIPIRAKKCPQCTGDLNS